MVKAAGMFVALSLVCSLLAVAVGVILWGLAEISDKLSQVKPSTPGARRPDLSASTPVIAYHPASRRRMTSRR